MIPAGLGLIWAAYGLGSWGWILVKGYNIPLRQWFSPLAPFEWPPPGQNVPRVPKGHLFPTSAAPAGQAAKPGSGSGSGAGTTPA